MVKIQKFKKVWGKQMQKIKKWSIVGANTKKWSNKFKNIQKMVKAESKNTKNGQTQKIKNIQKMVSA